MKIEQFQKRKIISNLISLLSDGKIFKHKFLRDVA